MKLPALFLALALSASNLVWAEEPSSELSAEDAAYISFATELWNSLTPQTGEIALPSGHVTLTVPEDFYYLSPEDADRVLVDAWGNPPGAPTLGMIFPAGVTPFDDDAWGVTIEYQEDGYVSDEDANDIDYSSLLKDMQSDTRDESEQRVKAGYDPIELVGWASQPYYDKLTHKLHWAQEIRFGETGPDATNTLNYNIRVLGRQGVLVMNFIADMDQQFVIDQNLNAVLDMAEFDTGSQYADFNPDIDKVAAYGIGALVAGKLAAKAGLLAAGLLLLKKFGIFALLAIAGIGRKLFGRKQDA
ncbi:DUF2167 domain-containing protein [Oceanobacter mangrovi]|uniref:DUF2167 domain-containing protein n=1 Tax=Oceanobacter mangrovi TaxID=2862510 RepID=UPI001C8D73BF|nr:DUF2167 domain-containing protein [Oceanobacter mangrovi]